MLGHLAQRTLGELGCVQGITIIERHAGAHEQRCGCTPRGLEQTFDIVTAILATAQLRQQCDSAAGHRRPRMREVFDGRLQQRFGFPPLTAPEVNRCVFTAAESEHIAATEAMGELGNTLAPFERPGVILYGRTGGDQETARPCTGDGKLGILLDRGRGGFIETAHARLHARAGHQRRAFQRETEHLQIGHVQAAPDIRGKARTFDRPVGIAGAECDVPFHEGEPPALGRPVDTGEETARLSQPAIGDRSGTTEIQPVHGQPDRHARGVGIRTLVAVETVSPPAGRERGLGVIQPPRRPAQTLAALCVTRPTRNVLEASPCIGPFAAGKQGPAGFDGRRRGGANGIRTVVHGLSPSRRG